MPNSHSDTGIDYLFYTRSLCLTIIESLYSIAGLDNLPLSNHEEALCGDIIMCIELVESLNLQNNTETRSYEWLMEQLKTNVNKLQEDLQRMAYYMRYKPKSAAFKCNNIDQNMDRNQPTNSSQSSMANCLINVLPKNRKYAIINALCNYKPFMLPTKPLIWF